MALTDNQTCSTFVSTVRIIRKENYRYIQQVVQDNRNGRFTVNMKKRKIDVVVIREVMWNGLDVYEKLHVTTM